MAGRKFDPRASDLMEPLRAAAGTRQKIEDAARRMRLHATAAVPVYEKSRPIGIITRAQIESALRFGLSEVPVRRMLGGGAPRVVPGADASRMRRAASGTAPALLVGSPRGPLLGLVTRHQLEDALEKFRRLDRAPSWLAGRDLRARMLSKLGDEAASVLQGAGALAGLQGAPLYLVGGVVRDLLLGTSGKDLDLVLEGDGAAFAEELGRMLEASVTVHSTFGTATIHLSDGRRIDVATARRETYEGVAALPTVSPGTILDDSLRRDVTINSMAIRLDGAHFGRLRDDLDGSGDLKRKLLRVHHPLSLVEDPTRAFRIARFAGRLGFAPAEETLESLGLAGDVGAFEALSGERLYREFALIAREPDPASAIEWCARMRLLDRLGPGLAWGAEERRGVRRLAEALLKGHFDGWERAPDPALVLLMILTRRARPAQRVAVAGRLKITGRRAERLAALPSSVGALERALATARQPSRVTRLCESAEPDALALASAAGPVRAARAISSYVQRYRAVRPEISGDTLMAMGFEPGPAFRSILERLRDARLDGKVRDAGEEARLARRLAGSARRGR